MQVFMNLFVVQCTPTGRRNWDKTIEKNMFRPFEESTIGSTKVLQRTVY
jgi:hypothetical protein